MTEAQFEPVAPTARESGDPLLKRLVDLAHLGWEAQLVFITNGERLTGRLISPAKFRAALADSIRTLNDPSSRYAELDAVIAEAIEFDDPAPFADAGPEPRFVHLADVRVDGGAEVWAPFLRLRLPAVSGFWVDQVMEPPAQ